METYADTRGRTDPRRGPLPAYGPVDAVVSYAVFYVFVERATPTVVEVLTGAVPDLTPSLVRFGLAAVLWFVLVVTLLDQVRRQLAALGVGTGRDVEDARRGRAAPTESQFLRYLVVVLLGGVVAAWTFEPAVAAGIALIRVVGTVDPAGFVLPEFLTMVVFFVAFGGATRSFDRLVVGGVRSLLLE